MPFIEYKKINFQKNTLSILEKANNIIDDWQKRGFVLTVRQIYYRFIALDWFPDTWIDEAYNAKHGLPKRTKNTLRNYKRLIDILVAGRVGGKVDWARIEDRTRGLKGQQHWTSPREGLRWMGDFYKIEKWKTQPRRVEIWFEKDALLGIAEHIATQPDIDVEFFSCRGYSSETAMWEAAQRVSWYREHQGQETTILQFSDHDPSGIDITRDIRDRFELFQTPVTVKRMALTIAQVNRFKLPPNPAKENDIRFAKYVEKFGNESWELDALMPDFLLDITRKEILKMRDAKLWAEAVADEKAQQELIRRAKNPVPGFSKVKKFLSASLTQSEPGLLDIADQSALLAKALGEKWKKAGMPQGYVNLGVQFIYDIPLAEKQKAKKGGKK